MYPPLEYRKEDLSFTKNLIRNNPFATLITDGGRLMCSHIPIMIKEDPDQLLLFGHLAAANQQCQMLEKSGEAYVVFRGPHGFISSSWYQQSGKISTWDYSSVQLRVKCSLQSEAELLASLKSLYAFCEGNEIMFEEIGQEELKSNLKHIKGFWFYPYEIENIAKWHQGYPSNDIRSVIKHLNTKPGKSKEDLLAEDLAREHNLNGGQED